MKFLDHLFKQRDARAQVEQTEAQKRFSRYRDLLLRAVRKDDLKSAELVELDVLDREFSAGKDIAVVVEQIRRHDELTKQADVPTAKAAVTKSDAAITAFKAETEKIEQQHKELMTRRQTDLDKLWSNHWDLDRRLTAARERYVEKVGIEEALWQVLGVPDPTAAKASLDEAKAEIERSGDASLRLVHLIDGRPIPPGAKSVEMLMQRPERAHEFLALRRPERLEGQSGAEFDALVSGLQALANGGGKPGRYLIEKSKLPEVNPTYRILVRWADEEAEHLANVRDARQLETLDPDKYTYVCGPGQMQKELDDLIDEHRRLFQRAKARIELAPTVVSR